MGSVKKSIWRWDCNISSLSPRLGDRISPHLKKGILIPIKGEPTSFSGKNQVPWKVETNKGIITMIAFRGDFFSFINEGIWNLEYGKFTREVDKKLLRVNELDEGDFLIVWFRDYFVASAILIRK